MKKEKKGIKMKNISSKKEFSMKRNEYFNFRDFL